jgi:energy-coupling factor transporter ATP-binding protein EcfA2
MSLLAENFRRIVAKDKDPGMRVEAKCGVGFPTGFLNFDFMNGSVIHVKNKEKDLDYNYYSIGIGDGTLITFIGRSGCGKSTMITQMAANIVRQFKTSTIFEDSIEGGMSWPRRETLSGFHDEELQNRYIVRDTGITAENFYKRIKLIYDMKMEDPSAYSYDTGLLDNFGNPLIALEPTVYILDSLALIMPEKIAEETELSGSMSTTSGAKVVTQIFRTIIPMLKSANIIVMVVNHILEDVNINPMQHKKAQIGYLKQGERLPKGNTVIYLSNNIIRLDDVTKLKENEKYHIAGTLVEATLIKSRSNRPNQTTTFVYDYDSGFDPILSLYVFLNEAGRVNGAGVGMYLDDYKDFKFSMGNIKQKLQNSPEFYSIFKKIALDELSKLPKLQREEPKIEHNMANDILTLTSSLKPTTDSVQPDIDI